MAESIEAMSYLLSVTIPDCIDSDLLGDPVQLGLAHKRLVEIRAMLDEDIDTLAKEYADSVPTRPYEHPILGEMDWHKNANRSAWDHQGVWREVSKNIAEDVTIWHDFSTGETLDPGNDPLARHSIVNAVVNSVLTFCSPSWKVGKPKKGGGYDGGLRSIGMDPDEFCKTQYGKTIVTYTDSER